MGVLINKTLTVGDTDCTLEQINTNKINISNLLAKINGTLLFESVNGEAGNIPLSISKNNFKKLEIIFGANSNDKIHYIVDTNSSIITLQRFYILNNNVYGYFSTYTLEEQQLTLTGVARGTFPNNIAYDYNFNVVYKIIGYE